MIDISKLIEAWKIFRDSNPYEICDGKEFRAIREPECCMGQMIEDTISLLKTQQQIVRCKDCMHYRYYGLSAETVSECTIDHCENPDQDWFCADGARKE